MTEQQQWCDAWAEALDRLESDVVAAEMLLAEEHRMRDLPVSDPWQPPAGLGPLPLDLRPRADEVLRRQLAVAQQLATTLAGTVKHAAVLERLDDRPAPRPSYVDTAM
jgi:hypothetical protein